MMPIKFIRTHNWLTVAGEGEDPPPSELVDAMATELTYAHIKPLFGQARFRVDSDTGETYKIDAEIESRRLYWRDARNYFNASVGFLERLWQIAQRFGIPVEFEDQTPEDPAKWQPHWSRLYSKMELRAQQPEALAAILQVYIGILDAAPGFGKSYLVAALALLLPRIRIAIVTKQITNVRGLVQDIRKYCPCGQVGDGEKQISRVTVYSAGSLHHYQGDADLMIGDEAHQLAASTYAATIAECFDKSRRIGLTATPEGRADNSDLRIESLFGPPIFRLTYQQAQAYSLVVPIEVHWQSVAMAEDPAKNETNPIERMKKAVWRNQFRNRAVAQVVANHPHDQILILVASAEHALRLGQLLPDFTLVYGSIEAKALLECRNSGVVAYDYMPPTALELAIARDKFKSGELRRAIATDTWSTGASFEQLGVLVRADARAGVIGDTQFTARVSRISEGKTCGIVYDFLDQFSPIFRGRAKRRGKTYEKHGWTQHYPRTIRPGD